MSKNFEGYILSLEEYKDRDPRDLLKKIPTSQSLDKTYEDVSVEKLWCCWHTAAIGSIDRFCKAHNINPMQLS